MNPINKRPVTDRNMVFLTTIDNVDVWLEHLPSGRYGLYHLISTTQGKWISGKYLSDTYYPMPKEFKPAIDFCHDHRTLLVK